MAFIADDGDCRRHIATVVFAACRIDISPIPEISKIWSFDMKRLHLHVSVPSIGEAVAFYSTLFDAPPSVVKDDYAKWMLDDPCVNLAISSRARATGVDHVGIQVDSPDELATLATRLRAAGSTTFDQEATTCCYARSDKSWVTDTAGVRWESFFTHGEATAYGEDEVLPEPASSACGAPAATPKAACC